MITSLTLRNFRAHRDTELALGQLTVLVGPNGGGKTSVLQALAVLGQAVDTDPRTSLSNLGAIEDLLFRQAVDKRLELSVTLQDQYLRKVGCRAELHGEDWLMTVPFQRVDGSTAAAGGQPLTQIAAGSDWNQLRNPGIFRFAASRITTPGLWAQPQGLDGLNTASALTRLKLADDPAFSAIVDGLRGLIPSVTGIRLPLVQVGDEAANAIEFDFAHAELIPASAVGQGALVLLALLTALHGPDSPSLLLIDDIERSLHPTVQMELADYLLALLKQRPDVQLVVTTYSPFVLDRLAPNCIQVCYPRKDGSIAVRPLSDHPDARSAIGTLSAGQIWTMDPESWVVEKA